MVSKLTLPDVAEGDTITRLALIEFRLSRLEGSVNKLLAAATVAAVGLVSCTITLFITGIVK